MKAIIWAGIDPKRQAGSSEKNLDIGQLSFYNGKHCLTGSQILAEQPGILKSEN